jgi:hypothetical protein
MAHAHDKTLIQQLGFNDLDKKDPLHDLACRYLADPDTAGKVADVVTATRRKARTGVDGWTEVDPKTKRTAQAKWRYRYDVAHSETTEITTALEQPIVKGEGKYKTVAGFLDVTIDYDFDEDRTGIVEPYATYGLPPGRFPPAPVSEWTPYQESISHYERLIVEVKATLPPLGDLLRQLAFYRQFVSAGEDNDRILWAVATPKFFAEDAEARLREHNVLVLHLGDAFTAWADAARQRRGQLSLEI